jgi:hypothetical protein
MVRRQEQLANSSFFILILNSEFTTLSSEFTTLNSELTTLNSELTASP